MLRRYIPQNDARLNTFFPPGGGKGYEPEANAEDGNEYSAFAEWLQCYYNPNMQNMVDNNKRTIWFSGPVGPMAPKGKYSAISSSVSRLYGLAYKHSM